MLLREFRINLQQAVYKEGDIVVHIYQIVRTDDFEIQVVRIHIGPGLLGDAFPFVIEAFQIHKHILGRVFKVVVSRLFQFVNQGNHRVTERQQDMRGDKEVVGILLHLGECLDITHQTIVEHQALEMHVAGSSKSVSKLIHVHALALQGLIIKNTSGNHIVRTVVDNVIACPMPPQYKDIVVCRSIVLEISKDIRQTQGIIKTILRGLDSGSLVQLGKVRLVGQFKQYQIVGLTIPAAEFLALFSVLIHHQHTDIGTVVKHRLEFVPSILDNHIHTSTRITIDKNGIACTVAFHISTGCLLFWCLIIIIRGARSAHTYTAENNGEYQLSHSGHQRIHHFLLHSHRIPN